MDEEKWKIWIKLLKIPTLDGMQCAKFMFDALEVSAFYLYGTVKEFVCCKIVSQMSHVPVSLDDSTLKVVPKLHSQPPLEKLHDSIFTSNAIKRLLFLQLNYVKRSESISVHLLFYVLAIYAFEHSAEQFQAFGQFTPELIYNCTLSRRIWCNIQCVSFVKH